MAYRLIVSGTIDFPSNGKDDSIKKLLEGPHSDVQVVMAIQQLEESAKYVRVGLAEIKE